MAFFIKSSDEGTSIKTVLIFRIVIAVFIIGITLTLFSLSVTLWQTKVLIQTMLKINADSIKEKIEFMMNGVEVDAMMYAALFQKTFTNDDEQKKSLLLFVMENLKSNKDYDGFAYYDARMGTAFRMVKDKNNNVKVVEVKPRENGLFVARVFDNYLSIKQTEIDRDLNQIDPRTFSFYLKMKEIKKPSWVNSRQVKNIKYLENSTPFLSYVVPLNDDQGGFLGLLSVDVGIIQLEELLGKITNQKSNFSELYEGVPFVLEKHNDEELLVIGYPYEHDRDLYPRSLGGSDYSGHIFLIEQHPDLRIQTFAKVFQTQLKTGNDIFEQEFTSIETCQDINSETWVYSWSAIHPGQKPDWIVGVCVNRKAVSADAVFTGRMVFLSLILMIIIVIPFGIRNGKTIGEPLEKMAADVVKIGAGDISFSVNPKSIYSEI
ncbi:MAG: hypothetical protein EBT92_19665, partial [Planctomycetes bacterium]|nr:hypothetical protein [Planctomycetota bacterium]